MEDPFERGMNRQSRVQNHDRYHSSGGGARWLRDPFGIVTLSWVFNIVFNPY